jgi:hypothetical protein
LEEIPGAIVFGDVSISISIRAGFAGDRTKLADLLSPFGAFANYIALSFVQRTDPLAIADRSVLLGDFF